MAENEKGLSGARGFLALGMLSVSVNAGVGVVHAVCERPWGSIVSAFNVHCFIMLS